MARNKSKKISILQELLLTLLKIPSWKKRQNNKRKTLIFINKPIKLLLSFAKL